MANTSLTLGPRWEDFIRSQIETGRYASASEVVRDALRELEDKTQRLTALRTHLAEGIDEADRGAFVEDFDMKDVIARSDARRSDKRPAKK